MLDGVLSRVPSYRLFSHAGYSLVVTQVAVGDAVTPASRRDGISPSRKLSCLGSVEITLFFHLASRPQTNCLFRLNESHTENHAKHF